MLSEMDLLPRPKSVPGIAPPPTPIILSTRTTSAPKSGRAWRFEYRTFPWKNSGKGDKPERINPQYGPGASPSNSITFCSGNSDRSISPYAAKFEGRGRAVQRSAVKVRGRQEATVKKGADLCAFQGHVATNFCFRSYRFPT